MEDFQNNRFVFDEKIDTTAAENSFENLLQENKTFFLNGTWGSGKTEFITKVQRRAITREGERKKNLILLDLWRSNDTSIFTTALRELSPKCFALTRFFIVSIICCFIWLTGIVKVPTSISNVIKPLFNTNSIMNFIGGVVLCIVLVASVSVVISKYLGLKLDLLDHFILERLSLENKVLVVDDFDRLTTDQQKNAYKLFTLLKIKNKIPIVFMGDYQKLACTLEENYLIKVIDQRVDLPFVLHPSKIWSVYFEFLENNLEVTLSQNFKNLFIANNRNLRDREQFHNYVCQEFFRHGKKGRVQAEEQLLVIYVYLFAEKIYQDLLNGYVVSLTKDGDGKQIEDKLIEEVIRMQDEDSSEYPLHFTKNMESYFIFEAVSNASVDQLKSILKDNVLLGEKFEESFLSPQSDFTMYVTTTDSKSLTDQENNLLLKLAVKYFKKYGKNSKLTRSIFAEKSSQILPFKIPIGQNKYRVPEERKGKSEDQIATIYFQNWSKILDAQSFDYSEKIRFFRSNYLVSYAYLAKEYDKMDEVLKTFSLFEFPEEMLLIYLSANNSWYKFSEWSGDVWQSIGQLKKESFIHFCLVQNVNSSYVSSNFVLAKNSFALENFRDPQDNTIFLEKMKSKIEELGINIVDL